jgi:hypothetical protein
MQDFKAFEAQFFDYLVGETSLKTFENWIYEATWLESVLGKSQYYDLVSYPFANEKWVEYDLFKIFGNKLDSGKLITRRLIRVLDSIIFRDEKAGESLIACYGFKYSKGLFFLGDLGIDGNCYDLTFINKTLSDFQKNEILSRFYPRIAEEAIKIKNLLESGQIVLDSQTYFSDYFEYFDHTFYQNTEGQSFEMENEKNVKKPRWWRFFQKNKKKSVKICVQSV